MPNVNRDRVGRSAGSRLTGLAFLSSSAHLKQGVPPCGDLRKTDMNFLMTRTRGDRTAVAHRLVAASAGVAISSVTPRIGGGGSWVPWGSRRSRRRQHLHGRRARRKPSNAPLQGQPKRGPMGGCDRRRLFNPRRHGPRLAWGARCGLPRLRCLSACCSAGGDVLGSVACLDLGLSMQTDDLHSWCDWRVCWQRRHTTAPDLCPAPRGGPTPQSRAPLRLWEGWGAARRSNVPAADMRISSAARRSQGAWSNRT